MECLAVGLAASLALAVLLVAPKVATMVHLLKNKYPFTCAR